VDELLQKIFKSAGEQVFDNFRWAEFCTAVGAAYAAGLTLANQMGITDGKGVWVAAFGAAFTALAYVRNPKMAGWAKQPTSKPVENDN
jgi:hypothetical protein